MSLWLHEQSSEATGQARTPKTQSNDDTTTHLHFSRQPHAPGRFKMPGKMSTQSTDTLSKKNSLEKKINGAKEESLKETLGEFCIGDVTGKFQT